MTRSRARRTLSVLSAAALLGALAGAAPMASAGPPPVDPASVSPTLNPNFAPWDCWRAGTGITCQGTWVNTYENEPIGIQCDGQEVYGSGSSREFMTRWHTADGLATRTNVHLGYPSDRYTLSPTGAGPSVTISGHWNRHYTYPVPGEVGSRVLTEVGGRYLGRADDGSRLNGSGGVQYAPGEDFETRASAHGSIADITGETVDAFICEALT
ncbi:hypothetical protein [Oryzobacter terrae]|uniref:hypothetical protein n=1 Tax=Oryzobacter terrae TaxID=1620385 RepID=UPI00366EBE25